MISRPPQGIADAEGGLKIRAHQRPDLQGFGDGQPPTSESRYIPGHCLPLPVPRHQPFRSISSSIRATSSLGRISSAFAIFHRVSKLACLSPFSIIVRCVRAIPAKPLKTSWDTPFLLRRLRMVFPTALLSNCTASPHFSTHSV